jgi:hypothetical protein
LNALHAGKTKEKGGNSTLSASGDDPSWTIAQAKTDGQFCRHHCAIIKGDEVDVERILFARIGQEGGSDTVFTAIDFSSSSKQQALLQLPHPDSADLVGAIQRVAVPTPLTGEPKRAQ